MKVAITGCSGFIGAAVLEKIFDQWSTEVVVLGRGKPSEIKDSQFYSLDLSSEFDCSTALKGVDVLIHCAARAHIMDDKSLNPLNEYRKVNTVATLRLASQAFEAGVKRFIYLSSAKVNGESTSDGVRFEPVLGGPPSDPYALSKYEAEVELMRQPFTEKMPIVIIRPPLVFGKGVKANFYSLMKLAGLAFPLPLGAITENRRSLVSLDNLVDFILTCIRHEKAANQIFLVSDGEDLSTSKLLRMLSKAMGRSGSQIPIPKAIIKVFLTVIGKSEIYDRLCGSLQVDITKANELLEWSPPYSVEESIQRTVAHYLVEN